MKSKRKVGMTAIGLCLAAGAPVALGQEALYYQDAGTIQGHALSAANAAGFTVTQVFDELTFISEMAAGGYDIAIYDNPANFNTPGLAAAVDSFVGGGARVHLAYWNLDADPALQAALGVASTIDIFTAESIHDNAGHPSWGGVASPVALAPIPDPWNDNGDYLTADGGSDIVATHGSVAGAGATVAGNGDLSIVNGWEYDTKAVPGVVDLLQAQMEWLLVGGASENALVFDYNSINGIGAAATDAAGLNPLVTTTPAEFLAALPTKTWRMVTLDNPSNGFDAATSSAIADYIDGGGRVHMSYWNLDTDPVLQAAFGVASATDFFDPRPVFEVGDHPSWGPALTMVAIGAGPSPWADNGDTLTVTTDCGAGGSRIVGEFDSSGSGEGAIVTTGQTLVNGFDYDSMDLAAVERLVTNQIRWLRSSGPTDPAGPTGCIADCNKDGDLDFFDFLCFQNNFAAGSCESDCDRSGALDFFDFLCFQNEFASGCPDLTLVEYGTEAPPAVDCGVSLTAFPPDARPDFTVVTDVPSPLGGQINFDIPMSKRTVPGSWGSWSHGYTGSLYWTQGLASLNMEIPSNSAYYLYVEPNPFALIEFEITGEAAGFEVSVIDSIEGLSGAKGFGFCGGVENINVRTTDGITDFAVGEFGIAN